MQRKYRYEENGRGYRSDFAFNPVYLNRNEEDFIYLKMLIDVLNIMLQRCYSFLSTKRSFLLQFSLNIKTDGEHELKYKVYQIRTSV